MSTSDHEWRKIIERKAEATADAFFAELTEATDAFQANPSERSAIRLRVVARQFRKMELIEESHLQLYLKATDSYL